MSRTTDRQTALQHADTASVAAHAHADATGSHARLSNRIWRLLHALGAPAGGRALTYGVDPEVLLTGDPLRPQPRDADGFPLHDRWQGTIPARWPEPVRNTTPVTRYPLNLELARPFDVAVASMHYNDIHLRSRETRAMRHRAFHIQASEALTGLRPGGHAVVLANHSVLDFPNPEPWARLRQLADFLGAVRLPSHALRAARACDAPVDVLVLRRRQQGTRPDPDLRFPGVAWLPQDGLHENNYFSAHPNRVLGTRDVGTDHWGMKQLAVHDPDHTWPARLEATFIEIAHQHGPRATGSPGMGPASTTAAPWNQTPRPQQERPGPEL